MKRIYESLFGNLLAPSAKEDYNIPYIDKKQVKNYAYSGFTYSFQIFTGDEQRLYTGISGFMGQEKRDLHCRYRGFYPSGMASGAGGEAGAGGGRALCAEGGVPDQR